jgi:hypothetical protein
MRRRTAYDVYWATLDKNMLVSELHEKIRNFYDDLRDTDVFSLIQRAFTGYYGGDLKERSQGSLFHSSRLQREGSHGQLTSLKMNHFRNLIKYTIQLSTSNKPALGCRATNSDYKSQSQTLLASGILDYYMREKKLIGKFTEALEYGVVLGEGWIHCPWNSEDGEVVAVQPDTGAPIYEGDLEFSSHKMTDVVRDVNREDSQHDWLIVRNKKNKWNLASKYPEMAGEIIAVDSSDFDYENFESFDFSIRRGQTQSDDLVTVWTFYHKKTESMPEGRMTQFCGDVCLFDGPIPYKDMPLYQCFPDRIIGTPYGYSPAFEILAPQQALDIVTSTIMTNQATNGVQNIWSQKGDDLSVQELQGGMKHIQSMEMPQPLQLTATAPEIFNFRQTIISEMETLMGINSTVRGNPEASLKSGSALALVVSQAVQFSSLLEASYTTLIEDVGTAVINQLRDFSQTKRVAAIIGEANRPFQREFTSDDLSLVNRVVVEPVSALSKTIPGRLELANNLLEKGMIDNARQYINIMQTGQLDGALEGASHENLNIRAENESLREGRPVTVIITDIHKAHILEHKTIIANPEAREDPEFVMRTLTHIQDHLNMWRSADPAILMITGQEPPPPPNGKTMMEEQMNPVPESMMTQQGPGPQQGPVQGQPARPGPEPMPGPQNPNAPAEKMPVMPNMPNLPPGAPDSSQAAYEKLKGTQ